MAVDRIALSLSHSGSAEVNPDFSTSGVLLAPVSGLIVLAWKSWVVGAG